MKIWHATVSLLFFLLVDLLCSFGLTFVGVVHFGWLDHDGILWPRIATETALDVAALAGGRCAAVMLLVCLGGTTLRGTRSWMTEFPRSALRWLFGSCQMLLASKAVAVAMYGGLDTAGNPSDGRPPGSSALPVYVASHVARGALLSELSLTYISIGSSMVLCGLEQFTSGMLWLAVDASCQLAAAAASHTDNESAAGVNEPLLRPSQENGGSHAAAPAGDSAAAAEQQQDEGEAKKRSNLPAWNVIKVLLKFTAPDWYILITAFFFGGLAAWTQALIPFYIGRIVDVTGRGFMSAALVHLVKQLVLVSAGCAAFSGLRGSIFTLEYAFLNQRIRSTLFRQLMKQDISFYDKGRTGDVISRLSADVQSVSDSICLNSNILSRSALQAGVVLYFMFTESAESWRLSVITFVLVPVILAICKVYGGYYRKIQVNIQSRLAEANSVAEEMVGSMTTVKAHGAEEFACDAYGHKLAEVAKLQKKQAAVYLVFVVIQTFLPNAMSGLVLYYGGSLIAQGKMDSGSLVAFMLYQQSLSAAFQAMGDVFSNLSGAVGAAEKVVEILQQKPEIPPCKGIVPQSFRGEVELRAVVFSYPTRRSRIVLNGFNLRVGFGEVVALVGPSGGGKSSIVKLMQRFYVPLQGQVLYDGKDVGDYDPAWLRKKVAMVGQEPVLYASSIYDNIVFGLPHDSMPSRQEVEEAAMLANAHSFISDLPQGYDTACGDKGVQMSGGQKQRIAIARALVRKPSILLLDEATSALDADSEHVVQEALDRVMSGRTVVVIAHRLSTVQDAHRIIVVKAGKVAEAGNHQQLVSQGGAYASLVRRQLARNGSGSFSSLSGLAPPE